MAKKTETKITKKPTGKVTKLALKRGSGQLGTEANAYKLTASWSVPSDCTKESNHRATGAYISLSYKTGTQSDGAKTVAKDKNKAIRNLLQAALDAGVNGGPISISTTSKAYNVNGASTGIYLKNLYPNTDVTLASLTVSVALRNEKGVGGNKSATYKFGAPGKPTVETPTQAETTGVVSCKIKKYNGKSGKNPCLVTEYQYQVRTYINKKLTEKSVVTNEFADDEKTVSVDIPDRFTLSYDDYIIVRFRARSKGIGGVSGWTDWSEADESDVLKGRKGTAVVAYPGVGEIRECSVDRTDSMGKVTLTLSSGHTRRHPVTGLRIQKLQNTAAMSVAVANTSDGWVDVDDVTDNGLCKGIALSVSELLPARKSGNTTYVRVKTWNQFERSCYRVGSAFEIKQLRQVRDTNNGSRCGVFGTGTGGTFVIGDSQQGKAVKISVRWTDTNYVTSATEVTWSANPNAWISTDGPTKVELPDSEAPMSGEGAIATLPSGSQFHKSRVLDVNVPATSEYGTVYYIRARRYNEFEGERLYGGYNANEVAVNVTNVLSGSCSIIRATPENKGTGMEVVVGYKDGGTTYTGTDVSWSTDKDAWRSNEEPSSYRFTWRDDSKKDSRWDYTTTLHVRGLTPDTNYWMRAYRYLSSGSSEQHTALSSSNFTVMTNRVSEDADMVGIVSAVPNIDGKSVTVVVGWREGTNNTGTEISWATDQSAWQSSDQPDTFQFTWRNERPSTTPSGQPAVTPGSSFVDPYTVWSDTATVIVAGLTEGETYYFRARRYLDGDTTAYTEWSDFATATPATSPSSVTVYAPTFVTRGSGCTVSWTYDSDAEQRAWQLVTGEVTEVTEVITEESDEQDEESEEVTRTYLDMQGAVNVIAHGTDALGSHSIGADRLGSLTSGTDILPIAVRVSTGGDFVQSEATVITIADAPELTLVVPETVTAQPASFVVLSPTGPSVTYSVTSTGSSGEGPAGEMIQAEGDVVWSEVASPDWAEVEESHETMLDTFEVTWPATGGTFDVTLSHDLSGYYPTDQLYVIYGLNMRAADDDEMAFVTWEGFDGVHTMGNIDLPSFVTARDGRVLTIDADAIAEHFGRYFDLSEGANMVLGMTYCADTTLAEDGNYATITMPAGLDLRDGARYMVTATASDATTGLASQETVGYFDVAWAHQAPAPSDDIEVKPYDVVDEDGVRSRYCVIQLDEPTGAAEDDVYDVYRVSADGPELIAAGVGLDATVTDMYAPYGTGLEQRYVVATRTIDGDLDWDSYYYELPGSDLRIDFGRKYVELPYNLSWSDKYQKDFEARAHVGEPKAQGYWNDTVEKSASFSTDIIKIKDHGRAELLRRLAQSPEPCFVRTPDGGAYQANVDVGISPKFHDFAVAVSLDVTGVALTERFAADVPLPAPQDDIPDDPEAEPDGQGSGSSEPGSGTEEPGSGTEEPGSGTDGQGDDGQGD